MEAPQNSHSANLDQSDDAGQELEVAYWKTAYFWKQMVIIVIWFLFWFFAWDWIMTSPWVPTWVKYLLTPKDIPTPSLH